MTKAIIHRTSQQRRGKARARFVLAAWLCLGAIPALADDPPETATPLTAPELLVIYGGKTWKWGEGGAYFDAESRQFSALTVGKDGKSITTGRWKITDNGKLCIIAKWGKSVESTETCFEHLTSDGAIYQRKLPGGGWYIFKHAKTDPEDEYAKLVRKDLVSGTSETN
jgi:hypothetical protein